MQLTWFPLTEQINVLDQLVPKHHNDKHNKITSTRIEGIGEWLLNETLYKRWCSESDVASLLWCHGGPGTGKTFLMYGRIFQSLYSLIFLK